MATVRISLSADTGRWVHIAPEPADAEGLYDTHGPMKILGTIFSSRSVGRGTDFLVLNPRSLELVREELERQEVTVLDGDGNPTSDGFWDNMREELNKMTLPTSDFARRQ